jgi:UDP-2,3-diacylglucosamine pyrophosphatase LpxH
MQTLILSDVQLGNGNGYDIYAGGPELPRLLERWASPESTVIFNGDTFDFLMNEDPLRLKVSRAQEQVRAICRNPETSAILAAIGKILAAGGEVVVRVGNHDIELALTEVQKIIREAVGQPRAVAARLKFELGEEPRIAHVNGARILVAQGSSLRILWQLFRTADEAFTFADDDEDEDGDLGLADLVDDAGLTDDEVFALEELLDPDAAFDFADGDPDPNFKSAALKMARKGLQAYARAQSSLVGTSGETFFELVPTDAEWTEAGRLAKKYDAQAVVLGHTHAARWRQQQGLTYVNSGTWIHLMQLPAADAGDEAWLNFLRTLRANPALRSDRGEAVPTVTRFTGVSIEPHPDGGAQMALFEWRGGETQVLSEGQVQRA